MNAVRTHVSGQVVRLPKGLTLVRRAGDRESRLHLCADGQEDALCGRPLIRGQWLTTDIFTRITGLVMCEPCMASEEVPYLKLLEFARAIGQRSSEPQPYDPPTELLSALRISDAPAVPVAA